MTFLLSSSSSSSSFVVIDKVDVVSVSVWSGVVVGRSDEDDDFDAMFKDDEAARAIEE